MNKECTEVRIVGVERLSEPVHSSNRAVWITPYRFDKIRVFKDEEGVAVQEIPFTQFLWRVFILGKTVWLNESLLFALREALGPLADESERAQVVDCGIVGGV